MPFSIKKSLITLVFLILLEADLFCQDKRVTSGLFFSSYEVIQDQRTSLNITPDKPISLQKKFSLEFDAKFRKGDGYYGLICRIIGDNKTTIDLVSNQLLVNENFWLIEKNNILFSYKWSDIANGEFNTWIKVRIDRSFRRSRTD